MWQAERCHSKRSYLPLCVRKFQIRISNAKHETLYSIRIEHRFYIETFYFFVINFFTTSIFETSLLYGLTLKAIFKKFFSLSKYIKMPSNATRIWTVLKTIRNLCLSFENPIKIKLKINSFKSTFNACKSSTLMDRLYSIIYSRFKGKKSERWESIQALSVLLVSLWNN